MTELPNLTLYSLKDLRENKSLSDNGKECIKECATIIRKFLSNNGSNNENYDVFVSGKIRKNVTSNIDWHTPESDNLTVKEIKKRGSALYKEIYKLIDKYGVDCISVSSTPIGYGCYKVLIEINSMFEVLL